MMLDPSHIERCLKLGICPTCGKAIPAKGGYGSGQLDQGIFCSLLCVPVDDKPGSSSAQL